MSSSVVYGRDTCDQDNAQMVSNDLIDKSHSVVSHNETRPVGMTRTYAGISGVFHLAQCTCIGYDPLIPAWAAQSNTRLLIQIDAERRILFFSFSSDSRCSLHKLDAVQHDAEAT